MKKYNDNKSLNGKKISKEKKYLDKQVNDFSIPKELNNKRMIPGRNAVYEVLRYVPNKIIKLYYSSENGDKRSSDILKLAKDNDIKLELVTKQDILKISNVDNNQGFLAIVKNDSDNSLKTYLQNIKNFQNEKICIVAVDSVEDPHNLGAIYRACECFGVSAVLICKNRGVCITPTVAKVAVGATELVNTIEVSNMLTAIRELKKEGFWCIAADVNEKSVNLHDFEFPEKSVLIVGAEGTGVKKALKDEADFIIKIPQAGRIDSLNVSQATAVILYQMTK